MMVLDSKPSFVDILISHAPEGVSPFAFTANYVAGLIPAKPDWYFKQLIAAGVVNGVALILTIVAFIVVARRRKAVKEGGSLWFFRTHYGHPSRIPYIMPHPLTMFLVWNALLLLMMQPYTWLNYFAWKYPSRELTSTLYFWYGFVFIFDGTGLWMSAFGTLYATLLPRVLVDSQQRKMSIMLHPIFLNFMCFAMPGLLIITQTVTASLSQAAWSKAIHQQYDLMGDLGTLSGQWLASNVKAFADSRAAFLNNEWAAVAWNILSLSLFSPTAAWLLITLKQAIGKLSQESCSTPGQTPLSPGLDNTFRRSPLGSTSADRNVKCDRPVRRKTLRRAYITAALQFFCIFLFFLIAIGTFMWVAIDIERVFTDPAAHALAILISGWVPGVVGVIINILIIIRMTGHVETTKSPSHPQTSRQTHLCSPSTPHTPSRSEFIEKPIALCIMPRKQTESDVELGMFDKSSAGGKSCDSLASGKRSRG
ncbi:unnamed protein product [Rhizoctonia solani]|uniref:Uncharacterized protein n=1 Tax=Rhizoctonia solani TaxID=456999 RepID=A0A8H3H0V7_9AGAM|nr:unnamed protein product [Rhizoctonia solani]